MSEYPNAEEMRRRAEQAPLGSLASPYQTAKMWIILTYNPLAPPEEDGRFMAVGPFFSEKEAQEALDAVELGIQAADDEMNYGAPPDERLPLPLENHIIRLVGV